MKSFRRLLSENIQKNSSLRIVFQQNKLLKRPLFVSSLSKGPKSKNKNVQESQNIVITQKSKTSSNQKGLTPFC